MSAKHHGRSNDADSLDIRFRRRPAESGAGRPDPPEPHTSGRVQVLKPTKLVVGAPGSGQVVIEAHATFKTSEAAAATAAESGRGPAQRKSGYEARACRVPKGQPAVLAAIAKAFKARSAGGVTRSGPAPAAQNSVPAAQRAAQPSSAAAVKQEHGQRGATADAAAARPRGAHPDVKPGAASDATAAAPHARSASNTAAAAPATNANGSVAEQDAQNGTRGRGAAALHGGTGSLQHAGVGASSRPAGMWGALGEVLDQAASAAPAASGGSSLQQLLSSTGIAGGGGAKAMSHSSTLAGPQPEAVGMSAAHTQLLGALGGNFGLALSSGLQAAPTAALSAAGASGITAAEQEVINALRAQAQLRSVHGAAAPAHPLLSAQPLRGAAQPAAGWPGGGGRGAAAAPRPAPAAGEAVARSPTPPAAQPLRHAGGVSAADSVSPQHMELLAALLNGEDVRSHPGYDSLRQVLLGSQQQQLTYDDLLRQRWSGT